MKAAFLIVILILVSKAKASDSCFNNKELQDLIAFQEKMNHCFTGPKNGCGIDSLSAEDQIEANRQRVLPFNREAGDGFMNKATGEIEVTFGEYRGAGSMETVTASGQKISSCHVLTVAHLFYTDFDFPVDSKDMKIAFKTGQTCDPKDPFENTITGAKVAFKMTNWSKDKPELRDYNCGEYKNGKCISREFYGHKDLVIIKLPKGSYVKNDPNHFTINTNPPSQTVNRVDCWGYPGSGGTLYMQKGAQSFGDENGKSPLGVITNAIAYKGMSGGGCVSPSNPRELIGLLAKDNRGSGNSAFHVAPGRALSITSNFIASFHKLAERYKAETNKEISNLEAECE